MAFYVGQKVVCVDAGGCFDRPNLGVLSALVEGGIYTVEWTGEHPVHPGIPCVRLVGISRAHPTKPDWPFGQFRFRPVVERKTDISIFTAMLTPNRQSVDA